MNAFNWVDSDILLGQFKRNKLPADCIIKNGNIDSGDVILSTIRTHPRYKDYSTIQIVDGVKNKNANSSRG